MYVELIDRVNSGEDLSIVLKGLTEDELRELVREYVGEGNGTTQVKACCYQSWVEYI